MTNRYCEWKADIVRPHLFVCLHWTAAAMTLPGKRSKQTQERGQRMEEGEANNEHWSMTQALWEHWSSHSRGGGGGGGLSPLSVPQSQIHSWYPPQKRWQWLASGQQPTPTPPTRTHLTIAPELLGVAFPHGWGQASMTHPPLKKKKKSTTKRFPRTQPAFTTTENTPQALSNSCQWLPLDWPPNACFESWYTIISKEAVEYLMPPRTHNICAQKKKVKALWATFSAWGTSALMDTHRGANLQPLSDEKDNLWDCARYCDGTQPQSK